MKMQVLKNNIILCSQLLDNEIKYTTVLCMEIQKENYLYKVEVVVLFIYSRL